MPRELIYFSRLMRTRDNPDTSIPDPYNSILPQANFLARAGPAALQHPSSLAHGDPTDHPKLPSVRLQKPQLYSWLMQAKGLLLQVADCLERAPGEQQIKSKPEEDNFLKKKKGKRAKPCGPSMCPAAAESHTPETCVKSQAELNRFSSELLREGGKSTIHPLASNCHSRAWVFCLRLCKK